MCGKHHVAPNLQAIFGVGLLLFIAGIGIIYSMLHEYRVYLKDQGDIPFCLRDFFKRERFFIHLYLALSVIIMASTMLSIKY